MLRAVFTAFAHLPLRFAHALGAVLGYLSYALSRDYRQRFNRFIQQAGFDTPAIKRSAIAQAGQALTELPWLWTHSSAQTAALVQTQGWEHVQHAQAQGKGIIFLTPHLGCFEITAQYVAQYAPVTVLYSPPKRAEVRSLVEAARARHQLYTAPASLAGVRQLARALKRGEWVGLLPDQVPGHASEGVWASYFGRPAYTMTLPLRLLQMSGAVVLLIYAQRLARGAGYRIYVSPLPETLEGDLPEQAQRMNAALEGLVRQCPEQYLWAYNRYKNPAF